MTNDRQQRLIDRLLGEAEDAVVAQRWDIVTARCQSVLALQPDHPDALGLIDASVRARGGHAVTEQESEKAGSEPASVEMLLNEAEVAADAHDWEAVETIARRALLLDPANVSALLSAAEAKLEVGDFGAAAELLDGALRIDPNNMEALLMASEMASEQGDWGRVRSLAQAALRLSPDNEEALSFLDDANERTGRTGSPAASARPVSRRERAERLGEMISRRTLDGWVVIDRDDRDASATLALTAKPVNHILHLLITLFTCGVWVIIWIVLTLSQQKEQRLRLSVDNFGNVIEERSTVR